MNEIVPRNVAFNNLNLGSHVKFESLFFSSLALHESLTKMTNLCCTAFVTVSVL